MKTYKTQNQIEKDIKGGTLVINDDACFLCDICINVSIIVNGNMDCKNILAENIFANNIIATNINAWNIHAINIECKNIFAWNIKAKEISYSKFCCVDYNILCESIKARSDKHHKPICLEGELKIINSMPKLTQEHLNNCNGCAECEL